MKIEDNFLMTYHNFFPELIVFYLKKNLSRLFFTHRGWEHGRSHQMYRRWMFVDEVCQPVMIWKNIFEGLPRRWFNNKIDERKNNFPLLSEWWSSFKWNHHLLGHSKRRNNLRNLHIYINIYKTERKNCSVTEMAKSMLINSGSQERYWGKAINTVK